MPLEHEKVQKKCCRDTFTTQLRYVVRHVLMRPRARACGEMLFCCEGTSLALLERVHWIAAPAAGIINGMGCKGGVDGLH
jgi:hypothetical protein